MNDNRRKVLCLDFDGVLHRYDSGWQGIDVIPDPPVPGAIEFIASAVDRFDVAIFSSRSREERGIAAMKRWLLDAMVSAWQDGEANFFGRSVVLTFGRIQWPTVKPPAHVSIDDRGVQFNGTFPSLDEIEAFQPWNLR